MGDGGRASRVAGVDGDELLALGPLPALWRAPTDNDEFGRFAEQWRAAGLHSVSRICEGLRAWQPLAGLASIQADWRLVGASGLKVRADAATLAHAHSRTCTSTPLPTHHACLPPAAKASTPRRPSLTLSLALLDTIGRTACVRSSAPPPFSTW